MGFRVCSWGGVLVIWCFFVGFWVGFLGFFLFMGFWCVAGCWGCVGLVVCWGGWFGLGWGGLGVVSEALPYGHGGYEGAVEDGAEGYGHAQVGVYVGVGDVLTGGVKDEW